MHDPLLAHLDRAEIAARQHVAGEAAYRGAEVVLGALRRAGIEGEAAASAFATLFAFTLAFVQQQLLTLPHEARAKARQRASAVRDNAIDSSA